MAEEQAVQIVSINEEGTEFTLHEDHLRSVLEAVPPEMHVAVISVVGAFRTGKSFLLNFMLRYLRAFDEGASGERASATPPAGNAWLYSEGDVITGCASDGHDASGSFAYRAGEERMTTGIWLWSRPFFLTDSHGERIAVLLVDTQGMFDRKTGMSLTSAIFGLSTLLSSHQIYNLKGAVQEDHLQQLALFTEYGRTAEGARPRDSDVGLDVAAAAALASAGRASVTAPAVSSSSSSSSSAAASLQPVGKHHPPFQAVTLLVRDSQFEEELSELSDAAVDRSNAELVRDIFSEGKTSVDIRSTREAIRSCFETIRACRLPHPGKAVTRRTFDGALANVDEDFLHCVAKFVRDVFTVQLEVKRVRHVSLTAMDTLRYMRAYAKLFRDATVFPEPVTVLEATAEANNRNATSRAAKTYTDVMARGLEEAGFTALSPDAFADLDANAREGAVGVFSSLATFGPRGKIEEARSTLDSIIAEDCERFRAANIAKDPLQMYASYLLPAAVAALAIVAAFFLDFTCAPFLGVCSVGSDGMRFVAGICFIAIVATFFLRGNSIDTLSTAATYAMKAFRAAGAMQAMRAGGAAGAGSRSPASSGSSAASRAPASAPHLAAAHVEEEDHSEPSTIRQRANRRRVDM